MDDQVRSAVTAASSASGARKRAGFLHPAIAPAIILALGTNPYPRSSAVVAGAGGPAPTRRFSAPGSALPAPAHAARPRRARAGAPPRAGCPGRIAAVALVRGRRSRARPRPARRPGRRERRREVLDRSHPGRRPRAAGTPRAACSSRSALEPVGGGGADDRADIGQAAVADARRPSPPTRPASALADGAPVGERALLDIGRARVRGAHEHEQAARRAARATSTNGASESRPSSGLTVSASTPRPATGPNGVGVWPRNACAYAAAVTSMSPRLASAITSSPASRARRTTSASAAQPRRSEPLEAGDLRLDGDALLAGGLDRQRAVGRDGARRGAGGRGLRARPAGRSASSTARGQRRAGSGSSPSTSCDSRSATRPPADRRSSWSGRPGSPSRAGGADCAGHAGRRTAPVRTQLRPSGIRLVDGLLERRRRR